MNLDRHALLTIVFALLGVLLALQIVRVLRRWNDSSANTFDFLDLVMENGKASKGGIVLMGAFAVTTWHFVYYSLLGKMSEGYFGLYAAAWIAPVVTRLIVNAPASPDAKTTTTTTTTTATAPAAIEGLPK